MLMNTVDPPILLRATPWLAEMKQQEQTMPTGPGERAASTLFQVSILSVTFYEQQEVQIPGKSESNGPGLTPRPDLLVARALQRERPQLGDKWRRFAPYGCRPDPRTAPNFAPPYKILSSASKLSPANTIPRHLTRR